MLSRLFLAFSTLVLTCALSSSSSAHRFDDPYVSHNDRVLLSDVESLLFQTNQMTTGRRSIPVQQMSCSGWNCRKGPDSIMCKNKGMTDNDIVWECTGHGLTPGYVMKGATVSCEGYSNSNDPYILRGSCGVTYNIEKDHSYQEPVTTSTTTTSTHYIDTNPYTNGGDFQFFLFMLVLSIVVFGLIMYATTDRSATTINRDHYYDNGAPAEREVHHYHNVQPRHVWYNPITWTYPRQYSYYHPTPYTQAQGQVRTTTTTVNRSTGGSSTRDPTTSTTYANTVRR